MALLEALDRLGEPRFRLRQIRDWKYRQLAAGYADMGNVPLALRQQLERQAPFSTVKPVDEQRSEDGGTTKLLFELADGQLIESVLMRWAPSPRLSQADGEGIRGVRNTVCVSSQAGCKMRCSFCATGHGGWRRNLESDEIVDQVLYFARLLKHEAAHVTNIVFMGMGEPLDNYDNLLGAIRLLNDPDGFRLGARNITVSTCGLVPQIRRLASEPVQVNLAVSLAATIDRRRDDLIPANRRWPIAVLLEACDDYARVTNRRVTYEYVLIAGVNDSVEEAHRLARLLHGRLAHVNVIPLNPVEGDTFARPDEPAIRRFEDVLRVARVPVSVRYSRGVDIVAGCGQLRARTAS